MIPPEQAVPFVVAVPGPATNRIVLHREAEAGAAGCNAEGGAVAWPLTTVDARAELVSTHQLHHDGDGGESRVVDAVAEVGFGDLTNPAGPSAFNPLVTSTPPMSRAFVKDDAPDGPPIIAPRAPLPPGVPNYVTPRGLALLRKERADLDAERSRLAANDSDEARREIAIVAARLADLTARLSSARLVTPDSRNADTVRFGATVTVRDRDGEKRRFSLVGVDEADVAEGRIPFTAPIARALIGKRTGETATVRTPRGDDVLTVVAVTYETA